MAMASASDSQRTNLGVSRNVGRLHYVIVLTRQQSSIDRNRAAEGTLSLGDAFGGPVDG